MSDLTFTPQPYGVFNEFDRQGLILGLNRLKSEKNAAYKQRLLDVFVNRADSTYRGLLNGITRELGLKIAATLQVKAKLDVNSNTLLPYPAVKFKDTKCIVYSDVSTDTVLATFDRWEVNGGYYTIQELADGIRNTGYFDVTIPAGVDVHARSMTLFNQSSATLVDSEHLDFAHSRVKLVNDNLIPTTVSLTSPNLLQRVSLLSSLRDSGQYFIDYQTGLVITRDAPSPGSVIRYESLSFDYMFQSSPVIISNLQSEDFKTKMFAQVAGDFINYTNSMPTDLGADIINELLTVFATAYGT